MWYCRAWHKMYCICIYFNVNITVSMSLTESTHLCHVSSGPPSAPLNLTIHHLNNTALILSWAAPSDLGGREEVMFDVKCRQNAGQAHDPFVPCGESVFILPQPSKLTETAATITGLHLHVSYKFSVRALNQISTALHTSGSEQSIAVCEC